jgi:hypothetical protein
MAATEMTPQAATITGTTLTAHAPELTDGNTFTNSGAQKIIVINNSGGALTFTAVTSQVIESTLAVDDRDYSLADGTYTYIGTFTDSLYGKVVTLNNFSTATNVVILALG